MVVDDEVGHQSEINYDFFNYLIGSRSSAWIEYWRMDTQEARKVLGLACNEHWHEHLDAFAEARESIVDLIRMAPTDSMALRYQEGLMEFDRAMAFFREADARKFREEVLMQCQEIVIPSESSTKPFVDPSSAAILQREEAAEPESNAERSGARYMLLTVVMLILISGLGFFYRQEYERREVQKQRLLMAGWEAQAAQYLNQRQWDEALSLYELMEKKEPNNKASRIGRQSVEIEMAMEQQQYINHWSGVAHATFETGVWSDVKHAISMVRQKEPNHTGMLDLEQRLALSQSEGERKKWRDASELAIEEQRWPDALTASEQFLLLEPGSEQALIWKQRANLGINEMRKNQQKALTLMNQSKSKDQGVYDAEILEWLREARKLDPQNSEIIALYDRVAAYGRNLRVPSEFKTLQEALAVAKAQDRIVIAAGRYETSVLIDAPISLESTGGEVILECDGQKGSVLSFGPRSSGSKIHGITVVHNSQSTESDRFSVIVINGAELAITECTVRNSVGHGVVAMGGAKLRVVDCRIIENALDGISAIDSGTQVTIENCLISGNVNQGINIWKGASGSIQNNRLNENVLNGILLDTDQAVTIKNNRLNLNREYGLVVRSSGASEITGNQFSQNLLGAVVVTHKGKSIQLSNNRFTKNQVAALLLDKGLDAAAFERNDFQDGAKSIQSKASLLEEKSQ